MRLGGRFAGSVATRALRGALGIVASAALILPGDLHAAQRDAVGGLEVRGAVYVNDQAAVSGMTVFAGDTIRTGSDGAASVVVAGRGSLILAAGTEITLSEERRFLAILNRGAVGLRALPSVRSFGIRVGDFVVAPSPEAEATAEIERAADGSARVRCAEGSVGVIPLEGAGSLFLGAGESATISADGRLARTGAPSSAPPPPPAPPQRRGARTGIIIAVAGGGAAAAAFALSRGKKEAAPVSPSVP